MNIDWRRSAQKDRGYKVGDKRIGESNAGVRRIFGRIVIAECETRDDADVKRQVAEVVQKTRAQTTGVFDNRAAEHLPKNDRGRKVEKNIPDCRCVRFYKEPAKSAGYILEILPQTLCVRGVREERKWT